MDIECHSPCDRAGVYIEEYDVYACPYCGDIAYSDNLETTSMGRSLLAGGDEDDFIRVIGEVVLDDVLVGPMAVIDSPYEATDDIKKMEYRTTERRWHESLGMWVILTDYRSQFADHMADCGWDVIDFVALRNTVERDRRGDEDE